MDTLNLPTLLHGALHPSKNPTIHLEPHIPQNNKATSKPLDSPYYASSAQASTPKGMSKLQLPKIRSRSSSCCLRRTQCWERNTKGEWCWIQSRLFTLSRKTCQAKILTFLGILIFQREEKPESSLNW